MPNLTLKFKDTTLEDYQLQQGHAVTIGRKQNNDVIIENLAVSGHHAKIDSVADGFVLITSLLCCRPMVSAWPC